MPARNLAGAFLALLVGLAALGTADPAAAQPVIRDWPLVDPSNDVKARAMDEEAPLALPGVAHLTSVDITSVSLDDPTEAYLVFRLKTQGGFTSQRPAPGPLERAGYSFHFRLKESDPLGITVFAVVADGTSRAYPERAFLCGHPSPELGCWFNHPVSLEFGVDAEGLLVHLPKSFLLRGRSPLNPGVASTLPDSIREGEEVTGLHVRTNAQVLFGSSDSLWPRLSDRAPDAGSAAYRLKTAANPADLLLVPSRRAVAEGETSLVHVLAKNDRGAKRLLNFSATLLTATEGSDWRVEITPTALVGSRSSTNVSLRIATRDVEAPNRATIRLVANVLNEPGVRYVQDWEFLAVPAWDAKNSAFHIHNWHFDGALPGLYSGYGLFTRQETEPGTDDQTPIAFSPGFEFEAARFYVGLTPRAPDGLREALPNPVSLRAEPARAHLEIGAPRALDAQIRIVLEAGSYPLGTVEITRSLNQGANTLDLDIPLNPRLNRLVPGTHDLHGLIRITDPSPAGFGTVPLYVAAPFTLKPGVSMIRLPIDREPEPVPREGLPRVNLAPAESLEDYVNTGERVVFEVDVRNEDVRTANVVLSLDNLTQGWQGHVLPALELSLKPLEEARIGVEVVSPVGAKEGEFSFAVLRAKWKETGDELGVLRFRITNTDGILKDNETFQVRSDDASDFAPPAKGRSPGGSALCALALLGAFYVLRRRRS